MKHASTASLVALALGLSGVSFAQTTPNDVRAENRARLAKKLDPLLEQADDKMDEARELMRQKRWDAALAACQAAIDILSPAPFTQGAAKSLMAEVYMEEGAYKMALDILVPLSKGHWYSLEEAYTASICYARLGRVDEGAKVVDAYCKSGKQLFWCPNSELPIAYDRTADNVEATMIAIRAYDQPNRKHPEVTWERLERAMKLAPDSGTVLYGAGFFLDTVKEDTKLARSYYRKAFRCKESAVRAEVKRNFEGRHISIEEPPPGK